MKRFIVLFVCILAPSVVSAEKKLSKGTKWDCSKDPVVRIGNGKGTYTFKGECKTIKVGGGENKLKIESVETLDIGGSKNTFTVGTVGTIDVSGSDNTITWKKAKSGEQPTLKGQPEKNTITQAE